jgi:hypothetical protein
MPTFRNALKPGSQRYDEPDTYYLRPVLRPVLRLGRKIVRRGDEAYAYDAETMKYSELEAMVRDEAERMLRCDCGSLMAEQLQRAVDTGEPIEN